MGARYKYEILGKKFNYLEVLRKSENAVGKFVCRCDCGNVVETTSQRLRKGWAKSCGCKKSELISKRFRTHGASLDGKNCREYQSYIAMWHRCFNEKRGCYQRYGGSGITVEEESWLEPSPSGYLNFLKDMGERPKGYTIERIDSTKDYCPENCVWATPKTQANNISSNINVTVDGVTKTVAEWCEITGLKPFTVYTRIRTGMPPEEAVIKPLMRTNGKPR